ncbi:hypothetical protein [Saccharicrinis sp. GN24d3]|uniref:hypothetical protein n=1 Tax=Saccharicrinis sp. GN24d3 TaxID=3458416 RepID=UPI0040360951
MIKNVLKVFLSMMKSRYKGDVIVVNNSTYENLFFGYYDVSPFNSVNNNLVLCHGEKNDKTLDILVYDIKAMEFKIIGSTDSWNYQQGARLMWFSSSEIIYNKFESGRSICVIKNINNDNEKEISYPIQALYRNDYMLSLSYANLYDVGTEYGYSYVDNSPTKDKLIYYDLKKKQEHVLFCLSDCQNILKVKYEKAIKNHFNHFLISDNGKYFIFIYRFYIGNKRVDNLMGYSLESNTLELLIEDQLISHCSWKNNEEFIFWGSLQSVSGYYMFSIIEKKCNLIKECNDDGHPSFIDDSTIITDTYPNKYLTQQLYLLDLNSMNKRLLLESKHPSFYDKGSRCDLHPSISEDKKYFQIDVIKNGRRKICIGKL